MGCVIGVSKTPGSKQFTRMPRRPRSLAIGSVMDTMPPLPAAYAICPFCPSSRGSKDTQIFIKYNVGHSYSII